MEWGGASLVWESDICGVFLYVKLVLLRNLHKQSYFIAFDLLILEKVPSG